MNMVRQELGLAKLQKRFPEKGTCLAIHSHVINSRAALDKALAKHFPWCTDWESELRSFVIPPHKHRPKLTAAFAFRS